MDFCDYFQPVADDIINGVDKTDKELLGNKLNIHSRNNPVSDPGEFHLAIFGINDPGSLNDDNFIHGTDNIRKQLYRLYPTRNIIKIIDLGNILKGKTSGDTARAVRDVVSGLLEKNVLPVIITGSQEYIYPVYLAYEELQKAVNIASVNAEPDLGSGIEDFSEKHFLSRLIVNRKDYLFNYVNIAYQTYLVNPGNVDMLNKLLFDSIRLGDVRENIREVEPFLRDSDIFSFNLKAVRMADAPGQKHGSPNGLYGEEACQIARYAGFSDKISSFGLFGLFPPYDINSCTASLAAQILWFFFEGYYQRKSDFPFAELKQYKKFIVSMSQQNDDIIFYKSPKSDRWWLEVSVKKENTKRNIIVACSYEDYLKACNQEIPDRWWKTYQKIC